MARSGYLILIASFVFSSMNCFALATSNSDPQFNVTRIQQLAGYSGQFDSNENTLVLSVPRDDLAIQMSGMQLTGSRGLASNIVFKKTDDQIAVSGDLVLLQDQVNPVLSVAITNGLQVTGLTNPYLWDSPRVMVMHFRGEGSALQLASAVGKVLSKIKTTENGGGDFPVGNVYAPATTLSGHRVDMLLGTKGQFKKNVYEVQFSSGINKANAASDKTIAGNTWAAFSGSDNEAIVNGALLVHQTELQQALIHLRHAQFYILSIYQHPINDDPTLVLVNFWGVGHLPVLAKALRASFLVAQNGNASILPTGNMLAESFAGNAGKSMGIIPISSSLVQNNYCSYANAFRISSASPVQENEQETKSVEQKHETVVQVMPKLVVKAVEKVAAAVELKNSVPEISRPSAKMLISKLVMAEDNMLRKMLLSSPMIKNSVVVIHQSPVAPKLTNAKKVSFHGVIQISAKTMLSNLSVVKNNRLENRLLQPHIKNAVVTKTISSRVPKLEKVKTPIKPVFSSIPVIKSHKPIQRMSMLSAREMLSKLSVVKNRRFI